MHTEQQKLGRERRGGDGLFVTLLFVGATSFTAAVFVFTHTVIASADTIKPYVPRNAVAYLHAGGRVATEALLSSSAQMPAGIRPDEVAIFAVPGDDALRRGVIVAWRYPKSPTPEDLRLLDERGAETLDGRHFLIGDGSLATSAKVAAAAHASLADDPERSAALDLMRSIAPMQFYADLATLLPPETVYALAELSDDGLPPLVGGITHGSGSRTALILTVADAAARRSILGYGQNTVRGENLDTARIDADIAIAEGSASVDLARLLIGSSLQGDHHPSPNILSEAGDSLRVQLAAPYALWLRVDRRTGNIGYLLRFPNVPTPQAKLAVARFFAAAEPSRAVMTLPDGELAVEFQLDEPQPGTDSDQAITAPKGSGLEQLIVGSDGAGGSLIASSATMIAEFRAKAHARRSPPTGYDCNHNDLRALMRIRTPMQILAGIPQANDFITALGVEELSIGLTVDNEIRICG